MKFIFTIFITLISLGGFSQENDSTENNQKEVFNLKDKLYFGGSFWVTFGNNTFVNISPKIGYKMTENFSMGLGAKYQYFSYRDPYTSYKESASIYGGSLFARHKLTDQLFLIGELEHINIENYFRSTIQKWTDFLLVGAGYQHNSGGGLSLNAQIMYDLLENPLLPYFYQTAFGLPIILRLGVSFGI